MDRDEKAVVVKHWKRHFALTMSLDAYLHSRELTARVAELLKSRGMK